MTREYKAGDVVLWNWKLTRLIGEGAYGRVFEAQREDYGMTYTAAIKIITIPQNESELKNVKTEGMDNESLAGYFRGFVEEMVREFSLMSQLKGTANIVSYEDHMVVPHESGLGWDIIIRMELLTSLIDYLYERTLTRKDAIQLGIDLCRAMELCQKFNIIHRDIKPENIFISRLGDFKLGDFGIARTVEKTTSALSKKGTYSYMAPEIYLGGAYGSNVDIYSLGIVLYRLLNGNRLPFLPEYPAPITHGDRESALVKRMGGTPLPQPSNADGRLAEIVLKACSYDPKDRYSSPALMRQELEAILYRSGEAQIIYPLGDEAPIKSIEYITSELPSQADKSIDNPMQTVSDNPKEPRATEKTSSNFAKSIVPEEQTNSIFPDETTEEVKDTRSACVKTVDEQENQPEEANPAEEALHLDGAIHTSETTDVQVAAESIKPQAKRKTNKILLTAIALTVVVAVGAYALLYNVAVSYTENSKFTQADSLMFFKSITSLHDENFEKYVDAGVMAEKGELIYALNLLSKLDDYRNSSTMLVEVRNQIYTEAQSLYRQGKYDKASTMFSAILDYGNSDAYYALVLAHSGNFSKSEELIKEVKEILLEHFFLEDAASLLVSDNDCAIWFLTGRWEARESSHFFEIDGGTGNTANFYLPHDTVSGTYNIEDGIFYIAEEGKTAKKVFSILPIARRTIEMYCYYNNSTYLLYRNE